MCISAAFRAGFRKMTSSVAGMDSMTVPICMPCLQEICMDVRSTLTGPKFACDMQKGKTAVLMCIPALR